MIARNDEVVLGDGQGTTRATVDPVQAVTSTFTSDGFGNPVAQWGSSGNPYRYAGAWGYRDDGDAGLLHVGARYYDPQVGRFISRDAVLSEHPYLYCEHEPIMRVDPGGFRPIKDYWDWFWGGAGSMAGGYIGGSIGGPVGGIIGGGIGGAIGLGIGDALWDLPKLAGDIWGDLKEGWNDLMNKLRKLRAGNEMLTEAGL